MEDDGEMKGIEALQIKQKEYIKMALTRFRTSWLSFYKKKNFKRRLSSFEEEEVQVCSS